MQVEEGGIVQGSYAYGRERCEHTNIEITSGILLFRGQNKRGNRGEHVRDLNHGLGGNVSGKDTSRDGEEMCFVEINGRNLKNKNSLRKRYIIAVIDRFGEGLEIQFHGVVHGMETCRGVIELQGQLDGLVVGVQADCTQFGTIHC